LVSFAGVLLAEELGDRSVVIGGVVEGLESVLLSSFLGNLAGAEFFEEVVVVAGIREDCDTFVVLCSCIVSDVENW